MTDGRRDLRARAWRGRPLWGAYLVLVVLLLFALFRGRRATDTVVLTRVTKGPSGETRCTVVDVGFCAQRVVLQWTLSYYDGAEVSWWGDYGTHVGYHASPPLSPSRLWLLTHSQPETPWRHALGIDFTRYDHADNALFPPGPGASPQVPHVTPSGGIAFRMTTFHEQVAGLIVPLWWLAGLTALPAVYAAWRLGQRLRRRHYGWCVTCGYDLRASSGRCPECGTARSIPAVANPLDAPREGAAP